MIEIRERAGPNVAAAKPMNRPFGYHSTAPCAQGRVLDGAREDQMVCLPTEPNHSGFPASQPASQNASLLANLLAQPMG